ncbi:prepilin peptidase [Oceanobacillus kapialis]|uniref:Prepilin peptidase n=1 Tax=Oceanobacillus kapialis TaxID=481353 RepID=A0ABW5Q6N9_9BACI
MLYVYDYLLFIIIIVAFIWDIKQNKIPNWLTAGSTLLGVICHLIGDGINGLLFAFFGIIAGGGVCLLLYAFKAIGAGDVKLFASIGAFTGVENVLYILMYSIVFGGIIGIFLLVSTRTNLHVLINNLIALINKKAKRNIKMINREKKIVKFPFMYAIFPAVIVSYYYILF